MRVYYNRREDKIMYEFESLGSNVSGMKQALPLEYIIEVPGISEIGFYDEET